MVLVGQRGGPESMDSYIQEYCHAHTQKRNNKLQQVMDLHHHTILSTITHILGSIGSHLDSRIHAKYGLLSLQGTMYNWCSSLFVKKRDQLTRFQTRWEKQFYYGSILVDF